MAKKVARYWDSFGAGFASVFDLSGTLRRTSSSAHLAHTANAFRANLRYRTDLEALAGDWKRVGEDLRRAIPEHAE